MKDFFISKSVSSHKSAGDSATLSFEHPPSQPKPAVATEPPAYAFPTSVTSTIPSDATDVGHVASSRASLVSPAQHDKLTVLKKPNGSLILPLTVTLVGDILNQGYSTGGPRSES